MKKLWLTILFCLSLGVGAYTCSLISDQRSLQEDLIRLHVVANSDSQEDQAIKLKVRDAVLTSIQEAMANVGDAQQAKAYLAENLPKIEGAANACLKALGCDDHAVVSLCKEVFDKRIYDTFSLPAGIYEALRVTIGEGEGHNWWCVAFPTLCIPAASADVEAVAADAGLSETAQGAITGRYQLRFYFLDLLGKLETMEK